MSREYVALLFCFVLFYEPAFYYVLSSAAAHADNLNRNVNRRTCSRELAAAIKYPRQLSGVAAAASQVHNLLTIPQITAQDAKVKQENSDLQNNPKKSSA